MAEEWEGAAERIKKIKKWCRKCVLVRKDPTLPEDGKLNLTGRKNVRNILRYYIVEDLMEEEELINELKVKYQVSE